MRKIVFKKKDGIWTFEDIWVNVSTITALMTIYRSRVGNIDTFPSRLMMDMYLSKEMKRLLDTVDEVTVFCSPIDEIGHPIAKATLDFLGVIDNPTLETRTIQMDNSDFYNVMIKEQVKLIFLLSGCLRRNADSSV